MPLKPYLLPGSLLLCLLLAQCLLQAQAPSPVVLPAENEAILQQTLNLVSSRYKNETAALTGENKKYIADLYKERFDGIKELFDKKELLADTAAQNYLQALAALIIQANDSLQPLPINCCFSKTAVPNAASRGEGLIVFNAGLFARLDNESQVAFVLCHELAHLYLNHNNKGIEKYVNAMYSRQTQEKLKKISRTEYGKSAQLEELSRSISFNSRRHSRDHETEADSLGLVFMKNTRFDVREALSCLTLLDTIDRENFDMAQQLRTSFSSPGHPFDPKWLEQEEGLLSGHAVLATDEKLADSLKTHPDCLVRVKTLQEAVTRYQGVNRIKNPLNAAVFMRLRNQLPYESIAWYFQQQQYSLGLYQALQLLHNDTTNAFAIAFIGKSLNAMYKAQQQHKLGKTIDVPTPGYPTGYNILLQFIQNLYIDDIAAISYHFLSQYSYTLGSYADYKTALDQSRGLAHGK